MGYPPLPKAEIRDLVGKGMQNLVRRALASAFGVSPAVVDDDEVAAALARYQTHYASLLGRETRLYPGVREGLERLAAMGLPLAVITNKATRFVRPHLDHAGLTGVSSGCWSAATTCRRRSPRPTRCCTSRRGSESCPGNC